MEWAELALAVLVGLGIGGLWERRHASREAEKQRVHTSAEAATVREHATSEARAARRFQIRLDAYRDASQFLEKQRLWVHLTEPFLGPAPDPPDVSSDDGIEFGGTIAVTASDEVREAMRAAVDAVLAFDFAVVEYRRAQNPTARHDPSKNTGLAMHNARQTATAAIEHAQTVMRDELADL